MSSHAFSGIDDDVLILIFDYLDIDDILRMRQVGIRPLLFEIGVSVLIVR